MASWLPVQSRSLMRLACIFHTVQTLKNLTQKQLYLLFTFVRRALEQNPSLSQNQNSKQAQTKHSSNWFGQFYARGSLVTRKTTWWENNGRKLMYLNIKTL